MDVDVGVGVGVDADVDADADADVAAADASLTDGLLSESLRSLERQAAVWECCKAVGARADSHNLKLNPISVS